MVDSSRRNVRGGGVSYDMLGCARSEPVGSGSAVRVIADHSLAYPLGSGCAEHVRKSDSASPVCCVGFFVTYQLACPWAKVGERTG